MSDRHCYDCLVIGRGPAGLAAATALAAGGSTVALVGPGAAASTRPDTRTAALFPPVVHMLRRLDAWDAVAEASAPLSGIRIIDQTGTLLRAPSVTFHAADVGAADIGFNIPNAALVRALEGAAVAAGVRLLDNGIVTRIDPGAEFAVATTAADARIAARLIVGADGRDSLARSAAGIGTRRWSYDQSALAATFHHSRRHRGISTELHRPAGPCTSVPLPGNASSLVWVERPEVVARLMAASDADFLAELEGRLGDLLGDLHTLGPRRCFPLTGLAADKMGRHRIALVGEAAHLLPPIGAQGLNLGMFDAATLAHLVGQARADGRDIGSDTLLAAYDRARAADMRLRQGAVDMLNRTLTAGLLPLDLLRGVGLHALAAAPALRRRLMEQGLAPPDPLPALMASDGPQAALPRESLSA